jgi:hypothetical protein
MHIGSNSCRNPDYIQETGLIKVNSLETMPLLVKDEIRAIDPIAVSQVLAINKRDLTTAISSFVRIHTEQHGDSIATFPRFDAQVHSPAPFPTKQTGFNSITPKATIHIPNISNPESLEA